MEAGRSKKPKKLFIIVLILIIYPICLGIFSFFINKPSSEPHVKTEVLAETTINPHKEDLLAKAVEGQLEGTKGIYGIAILNLENHEKYFAHEHRLYKAASLYKLWIMAVAFEQIRDGKLKEDDILSRDIGELYAKFDVATPSAQTEPQPTSEAASVPNESKDSGEPRKNVVSFTVAEALEKMIIVSDNTAALLLSEKVRLSNVAAFLKEQGFLESKINTVIGYPVTTPHEMALFMKKLYMGELNNKKYTDKMIALLKRQRLNGKLPKYLPAGTVIAHKTGELENVTHDVGIVYTKKGDYIISIFSESTSRVQAEQRIANVSEAVYKYFMLK